MALLFPSAAKTPRRIITEARGSIETGTKPPNRSWTLRKCEAYYAAKHNPACNHSHILPSSLPSFPTRAVSEKQKRHRFLLCVLSFSLLTHKGVIHTNAHILAIFHNFYGSSGQVVIFFWTLKTIMWLKKSHISSAAYVAFFFFQIAT